MEIKPDTFWLDKDHPNFERWERSRLLSLEKGKLVRIIVETELKCSKLNILDLGSGEGGTSTAFSAGNTVYSLDIDLIRLKRQNNTSAKFPKLLGSAERLPFRSGSFDLIILQDVIEHFPSAAAALLEVKRVLKTGGAVYLSTPNKISLFNIISDPHWGFPLVSLLNRERQRKYFLPYFRKSEINRTDTAQLFTLKQLENLFSEDFELKLKTTRAVNELFNGNKGIVWSRFHLRILKLIRFFGIQRMILTISNDKFQFINTFLTPTFYFILKKKQ